MAQARLRRALSAEVRSLDLIYRAEGSHWRALHRRGMWSAAFLKEDHSGCFVESRSKEDQLGVAVAIFWTGGEKNLSKIAAVEMERRAQL